MRDVKGTLHKMHTKLANSAEYTLKFNDHVVNLNDNIGQDFSMTFTGNIFCIQCARKTNKSFQQGYCFPCLRKLQECNLCMIHPERCNVESGTCPENDWAHSHCNQPHIIYLANASGLKIGITRETNVPTRWLDQGAIQALPLFRVSQRALAGKIEVIFKKYVADKTNWQAMLKNAVMPLDLIAERDRLLKLAETELNLIKSQYQEQVEFLHSATPLDINYPVLSFPQKIISLSFDKTPTVAGKLVGIKGQYLIFDKGVINIRKFGGFEVSLAFL